MSVTAEAVVALYRALANRLEELEFSPPVAYVYNPLQYAWETHQRYLSRFLTGPRQVVLLGMNPGPWGMAQTGVPFGEVQLVRGWLGIEGEVGSPVRVHPARPVVGFACGRREVSGLRLWGWARERWGEADRFLVRFAVLNYCPLMFLDRDGRNLTPDRLPARQREALTEACDGALRAVVQRISACLVVGLGRFARRRATAALGGLPVRVGEILHPSPANPQANRGWAEKITAQLAGLGVEVPGPGAGGAPCSDP